MCDIIMIDVQYFLFTVNIQLCRFSYKSHDHAIEVPFQPPGSSVQFQPVSSLFQAQDHRTSLSPEGGSVEM